MTRVEIRRRQKANEVLVEIRENNPELYRELPDSLVANPNIELLCSRLLDLILAEGSLTCADAVAVLGKLPTFLQNDLGLEEFDSILDALSSLLESSTNDVVIREAILALQQCGGFNQRRGTTALIHILGSDREEHIACRLIAMEALRSCGTDAAGVAVPQLIDSLQSVDPDIQLQSIRLLGWLGPEANSAVPELIRFVEDSNEEEHLLEAVKALVLSDPEGATIVHGVTSEPLRENLIDLLRQLGQTPLEKTARRLRQVLTAAPDSSLASEQEARLVIERWADIGIGIDESHNYRVFTRCPRPGARIRLSDGAEIRLNGGRFRELFDLMAMSEFGNLASKNEFSTACYRAGRGQLRDNNEASGHGLTNVDPRRAKWERNTIADLNRILRESLTTQDESPPLQVANGDRFITAQFQVRCLVRDQSGHYTFGDPLR